MQTTSIQKIDNKYTAWKNTLGFYKDELEVFTNRLNEVAAKNTATETMQIVEHFQNQFLIQAENIDILQHDINEHVSLMADEVLKQAAHVDRDQVTIHFILQERVEKEAIIFKGLREEFMQFLSKIM